MSYEVGLLCRLEKISSPRDAILKLAEGVQQTHLALADWGVSDAAASCTVRPTDEQPFAINVNIENPVVFDLIQQAWKEGAITDQESYNASVSFLLSGEEWTTIRAMIDLIVEEWHGVLYDEVSGFLAKL